MSDRIKALREQRAQAITEARAILDGAEAANRELTAEENSKYDEHVDRASKIADKIAREERQVELDRSIAEQAAKTEDRSKSKSTEQPTTAELQMRGFRQFLRSGIAGIAGQGADEFRALQADADVSGGFIATPQQFVSELLKNVDNATFVRQAARIFPLNAAESLGVPSLDSDPADADWTSELATGDEDTAMSFGKRELRPHPLAKRIKVSNKLIRVGAIPVEALVADRLGYKFGVTAENAYLNGSGSGQPLGIFTASDNGISTSRDVATGNTTTAPTFDGLIEAKYTLKGQYWNRARWTWHRDGLKLLAKIKDGEGQYIWRQSVREGEADTLLGLPIDMSEYCPNTFTTGLYVGALGDWSNYWIADAMTMQMQRLSELYAETNQTGFIGRLETDGMPVLEEAFVRVKLA